jgi:hypothetical protein
MVFRNNADLGKGVPRRHVFHEAWELLFFLFFPVPLSSVPSVQPTTTSNLAAEAGIGSSLSVPAPR